MILRHLYLYLHLEDYPDEVATPFGFRTRYVCNFLERRLKATKFQAEGFSKICVQGRRRVLDTCPIVPENALLLTVAFDQSRYESLRSGEEHEFFIDMLVRGLERCNSQHEIPLIELKAALEEFRLGGYRNEWTHQKKLLRQVGVVASLLCSLDSERFRLTLKLDASGVSVFEQQILETKPDEIIFAHRFKEISSEGGDLIVKDKFGKALFSLSEDSLRRLRPS